MDNNALYCVIGLGQTGLSCVRFLTRQGLSVVVMDTRETPPHFETFRETYPNIPIYTGKDWPQAVLNQANFLVVSPGVSTKLPAIQLAKKSGAKIIGDIELFAHFNQTPVIAITGANGKSTVTTLVGEMARAAGKSVAVVGNIGTPVLDHLVDNPTKANDIIVMELSSFQLETTENLHPFVSTVLNITPDHLDRYASLSEYVDAKHRVYRHAQQVVINKEDPMSDSSQIDSTVKRYFFTLGAPLAGEFGVVEKIGKEWLAYGNELLLPTNALKIAGKHNVANALSALALGHAAGFSLPAMIEALKTFSGLTHRCQWVGRHNDIVWINDSKGTNIGACQAALQGLGAQLTPPGKIIILLGGDGKGADFADLSSLVQKYCRAAIVMGKATPDILAALEKVLPCYVAQSMTEAVGIAATKALPQDMVLLSPACSSLDQYRDFAHRGETFTYAVKTLLGDHANAS